MIPSQKEMAASICIQFGEHYLAEKDYAKAVRSYKDALSYSPTDNKVGSSKPNPAPSLGARCPAELPDQGRGQFLLCASLRSSGVRGMEHLVWGADSRASDPKGLPPPWSKTEKPHSGQPFVEGRVGKTLLKVRLVWCLRVPLEVGRQ